MWRGWWGEVRFNLAGTVRFGSIRYGMVGSGEARFGRLGGVGFGSLP